jgi:hypothetical protein
MLSHHGAASLHGVRLMTVVSFLVEMTGSKYVTAGRRSGMNLAAASEISVGNLNKELCNI